MATFKRFEDIDAWQQARELTREIYRVTADGIFSRDLALCNQIRRASISIMSNIAEGYERSGTNEFIHFLSIAKGSTGEIKSQLYIALDQNYIDEQKHEQLSGRLSHIAGMISNSMNYLRRSSIRGTKYKAET
ncbi:MAG: four helix bundle protein [Deltaproteobacteria bacterium]|nr:four helix bundle protein [Deltaproteobacteria bacterium]MBN2687795.1 four helix bundle protein [Deltaproteobacteria bacterium]